MKQSLACCKTNAAVQCAKNSTHQITAKANQRDPLILCVLSASLLQQLAKLTLYGSSKHANCMPCAKWSSTNTYRTIREKTPCSMLVGNQHEHIHNCVEQMCQHLRLRLFAAIKSTFSLRVTLHRQQIRETTGSIREL